MDKEIQQHQKDDYIIDENSSKRAMYILLEGEVESLKQELADLRQKFQEFKSQFD